MTLWVGELFGARERLDVASSLVDKASSPVHKA
jgi:hypothetical protein